VRANKTEWNGKETLNLCLLKKCREVSEKDRKKSKEKERTEDERRGKQASLTWCEVVASPSDLLSQGLC
jgi:hypothetical protein